MLLPKYVQPETDLMNIKKGWATTVSLNSYLTSVDEVQLLLLFIKSGS